MNQKAKIIQPIFPTFDWSKINIESFRGPDLTFPSTIHLVVAPSFNEYVIGAMASFREYYGKSWVLDPEEDGFQTHIKQYISNNENNEKQILSENDLAIVMKFIDNYERILIITMGNTDDLITRH